MIDLLKRRPLYLLAAAVFFLVWFYMLGARALVPTDEGRYAEMSREMAASGDWITPRLDGIKYFEKPPLQIWMTALAFKAFGLGEWQARLWTGLCGLLGIALVGHAGAKIYGERIGLTAAAILASTLLWSTLGHLNTLDMGLSAMMTLTLCGMLTAQRDGASPAERRGWMMCCWAGMALAVLSKGLIGVVLPGAVLTIYTFWSRDWKIWNRLHPVAGISLFLAIVLPWFFLVSIKNPEFAHFFFIHEHWERFTSKVHHREGPWHYFIPVLALGVFPWLGILCQALLDGLREPRAAAFQPGKMLIAWFVFIFVFFSISSSKLPSYILPVFPPLSLLLARRLQRPSRLDWAAILLLVGAAGVAGFGLFPLLPSLSGEPAEAVNYAAAQPWLAAASAVLIAVVLFAFRQIRRASPTANMDAVWLVALGGFLAGQMLMAGAREQSAYRAGLQLVPATRAEITAGTTVYMVGMYDQTLPFYLQHTAILVEHQDEMEFGLQQEPWRWIPTREEFIERWRTGGRAIAITRPEIYAQLAAAGLPMRMVARDTRRVVIINQLK